MLFLSQILTNFSKYFESFPTPPTIKNIIITLAKGINNSDLTQTIVKVKTKI